MHISFASKALFFNVI